MKETENSRMANAFPEIETERLLLRKLSVADASDMYEYAQDVELAGLGLWKPLSTLEQCAADLQTVEERYAAGDCFAWALEVKAERKMIGRAGFVQYSSEHARAELGYALNRRYWGQGYMTEATKAIIEHGFRSLHLHRVEAICLPENRASIRILEKVGMRFEGMKREATFVRGKFDDLHLYGLLQREWAPGVSAGEAHDEAVWRTAYFDERRP
jgi:[ribosomal protein S5]-alanine N-acetyltransferase